MIAACCDDRRWPILRAGQTAKNGVADGMGWSSAAAVGWPSGRQRTGRGRLGQPITSSAPFVDIRTAHVQPAEPYLWQGRSEVPVRVIDASQVSVRCGNLHIAWSSSTLASATRR